ncbi:MAG: hypothetical protein QXJ68_05880 [Methanocellales archaeon]
MEKGPKYPFGYTKMQIQRILLNYPDGIDEPKLRSIIKQELGILDPKGIKIHFKELEAEGSLVKEEKAGKKNIWRYATYTDLKEPLEALKDKELPPHVKAILSLPSMLDKETLQSLRKLQRYLYMYELTKKFLKNEDYILDFMHSKYCERLSRNLVKEMQQSRNLQLNREEREKYLTIISISPGALEKEIEGLVNRELNSLFWRLLKKMNELPPKEVNRLLQMLEKYQVDTIELKLSEIKSEEKTGLELKERETGRENIDHIMTELTFQMFYDLITKTGILTPEKHRRLVKVFKFQKKDEFNLSLPLPIRITMMSPEVASKINSTTSKKGVSFYDKTLIAHIEPMESAR